MLHSDARKSKEAEYKQELLRNNPENAGWADGEEKTAAVRQDTAFEKRNGEILYVPDASKLMPTVPTSMSKLSNTKYVRNNTGASGAQQEDTDQDTSTDQMREQCRLYKKDRLNFVTQAESSEYAAVYRQWESAMAGVVETTSNGAGEFARLQVRSAKVQPLKLYADHCLLFQRSTKSLARQGWHHDHMQIAQLDTRDLTVIM